MKYIKLFEELRDDERAEVAEYIEYLFKMGNSKEAMKFSIKRFIENYIELCSDFCDYDSEHDEKKLKFIFKGYKLGKKSKEILSKLKDIITPYATMTYKKLNTNAKLLHDEYDIVLTIKIENKNIEPLYEEILMRNNAKKYNL